LKGLILAQNERWRRGLGMQVEREGFPHFALSPSNWLRRGEGEVRGPGQRRKGE